MSHERKLGGGVQTMLIAQKGKINRKKFKKNEGKKIPFSQSVIAKERVSGHHGFSVH